MTFTHSLDFVAPPSVPQKMTGARPAAFLMTDQLYTGGTERQFVLVSNALCDSPVSPHLGCLARVGPFVSQVPEIEEFPLGGRFWSRQAHRSRHKLASHLRKLNIQIAHSFDFYSNLMLIPVARFARVPVVVGSLRSMATPLNPLQFGALTLILQLCDCIVCNSRAAASLLADHGLSPGKLVVIPNALAPEAFSHPKPALPKTPNVVRIGMIARMNDPIKNQELFLRAAARVARQFPEAEFVLVGDGLLRQKYESLARGLGIAHRTRFLGERHDIPAVLAALDMSVVPSRSESLSNVALESMASGKPVVATRVGGNRELVRDGETGRLVVPEDEQDLAAAIGSLVSENAEREGMGRTARDFAWSHFRLKTIRDRYAALYESLLAEKKHWPIRSAGTSHTVAPGGRIRVAVVAPSMRKLGGQSVQADLLLRFWRNDPDAHVQLLPVDPELPAALGWIEGVRFLRTAVRTPLYLASLLRVLRDADVAHVFSASYWSFLLAVAPAAWCARTYGNKLIVNYHSGEARDHLANWRTAVPLLKKADRVVVPSGFLRDVFAEFGVTAEVVPNVVDLTQFSYRPRRPLLPHLICTRGFEPYYDVDLVVRAFSRVRDAFPAASLCLAGAGSLEEKVRATVHELRLGDVEFTGPVSRDRIGRFYDRNHIFVNASWLDNMPVSLLEAFASGTPVVTTAPEGIRYLVEHERTGLLCAPKDWQGLADNALRLLRYPDFALELAQNAYEESRHYRWESVRGEWLRLYRSVRGMTDRCCNSEPIETSSLLSSIDF